MSERLNLSGAISHPRLGGLYRVPMRVDDGVYTIQVTHNMTRSLSRKDLPDVIKTKLAFINSVQKQNTFSETVRFHPTWMTVYELPEDESLHDVGWRVVEGIYCLVLNQETIDLLVGRTLNKERL